MITVYKSDDIQLSIEFEDLNDPDNVFGKLRLSIEDEIVSTLEIENLGYFYVDCESFLKSIENKGSIENPLFELDDDELLRHYSSWINHNIEDEETSTVHFFDSNYFLTGSQFSSYFFDHIMLMYVLKKSSIHFKFWNKLEPREIKCVSVSKDSLVSSFILFLKAFDDHHQSSEK